VLARWDGRRRYANLRKLARLARAYEALRGADLEGFVRFVRDQDALGARELEAVAEEEGADAVRLLTIHAAKGLEFKVVIVADAGRDTGGPPTADEIVALPDGRFGFRTPHPTRGGREPVFGWDEVSEARRLEERAERLRLYYVAMTRAIDRLIVSGSIDPARQADRQTPIGWVLSRLEAEEALTETAGPLELVRGDARWLVRLDRHDPARAEDTAAAGGELVEVEQVQLALFADPADVASPRAALELPALPELPEPPLHELRQLSYSAIALFERCSYRYWAERVAGLRPRARPSGGEGRRESLAATEIGDAVHRLLEQVDLRDPVMPALTALEAAVRDWYPTVAAAELQRIAALTAAFCGSSLARRLAGLAGARPERPFAFEQDGVLLHGRLDVLWRENGRALVVDYKTNALAEAAPAAVVEHEYRLQRLVYALACLLDGAEEVEVVYQFLERPDEVVSATFAAADRGSLEAELSAAVARLREGRFVATPSELACADCPALGLVCAGPGLGAPTII
jgi:ATP-dependent exoDNAse (exonuclease V) beta subunit